MLKLNARTVALVETEILKPDDINIMRCASALKAGELVDRKSVV